METPLMDNFLSNLSEDKNGNIVTKWQWSLPKRFFDWIL